MINKSFIQKIVSIVVLLCFLFSFLSVGAYGFSVNISGLNMAFGGGSFGIPLQLCYLLALLFAIAAVVFNFLPKKILPFMANELFAVCLSGLVFVFIILGHLFIGDTAGMGGPGFGWWLCLILSAASVAWYFFGGKIMKSAPAKPAPSAYRPAQAQAPQQKASFCTVCGAKIAADAKFCPSCGAPRK